MTKSGYIIRTLPILLAQMFSLALAAKPEFGKKPFHFVPVMSCAMADKDL